MSRSFFRLTSPLVAGSAIALAMFACGSDDDDNGPSGTAGTGGTAGAAGSAGTGTGGTAGTGTGGTAGTGTGGSAGTGTGGSAGSGDGDVYVCFDNQTEPDPGGSADEGEECCGGLGLCTPSDDVDDTVGAALGHEDCSAEADLKCAPNYDLLGDAGTDFIPPTCEAAGDVEGRCIPTCFLAGNPSAGNLTQGSCDDGETCAPCYNPLDGEETGACRQNGDEPAEAAPDSFPECGDGAGFCVPDELVGDLADSVPQADCEEGSLCAPKGRVADPSACFEKCTFSLLDEPGACVPAYILGDDEEASSLLQQDDCQEGELCAPCVDPRDQQSTGACE